MGTEIAVQMTEAKSFEPKTITVKTGDTVVWKNMSDMPHSVTDVPSLAATAQDAALPPLCGEEKSSADKVLRTPLSKQRNKHIQHVLVEAAKLAPSQNHELALVHERELQKGNRNRATLAVARKMVAYLLAVDRQEREFVPAGGHSTAAA
jgi:hypothetical protein